MEALLPGYYRKTPFIWEPGCVAPAATSALQFEPAAQQWLLQAIAGVMAASADPSDQHAVARLGPAGAAADLLSMAPQHFAWQLSWWRLGRNSNGEAVGFVLPVVSKEEDRSRNGRSQGTIFYMGVVPECRGRGYSHELLAEATRIFIDAGCWRIFCDTGTENQPMVSAFRRAGYRERSPWQRPVA